MDLQTEKLLIRAFADFILMISLIAGEEGVSVVEAAFARFHAAKLAKAKTTKKRAKRKKS